MKELRSFVDLIRYLRDEESCREFLEKHRWHGEAICPHCHCQEVDGCYKHYKLNINGKFNGLYKCKRCKKRFTVTVGTMFEGSHVALNDWFYAIWIFLNHKKGISSVQLAKDIGVTQKTAWFMLNRIRHNFEDKVQVQFKEETQVDETYVGGKIRKRNKTINKNKENDKNEQKITCKKGAQGRSQKNKTVVMGLLSDGMVCTITIPEASGKILKGIIRALVPKSTTVVTDGWKGYNQLHKSGYSHEVVIHKEGEYVNEKGFHTNSIEGFWSHLKRGILGIYHLVSRKHLQKYCNEFAFRYNTRHLGEIQRFAYFLPSLSKRLSYWELTHC